MNKRIASRMSVIAPSLTLAITAKAKAMKAAGEPVVSFGAGEPDFNTPAHIIDAAKAALDKGYTKYTPSSGLLPLRKAICDKFRRDNGLDYDPSQVIVSEAFDFQRLLRRAGGRGRGDYSRALLADLSRSGEGVRRRSRLHRGQTGK